jgi:hypothetical protein
LAHNEHCPSQSQAHKKKIKEENRERRANKIPKKVKKRKEKMGRVKK